MDSTRKYLTTWNQFAPRSYVRQVYCFPYRCDDVEPLRQQLASALARAAEHFPDVAGKVALGARRPGHIVISRKTSDQIPLEVFDHRQTFGCGYADLKARGFPASAFVDPSFNVQHKLIQGGEGIPAAEVHARVIDGGLLLYIYFHHSITDGIGMCKFISTLAAYTRAGYTHHHDHPFDIHIDLPANTGNDLLDGHSFESALELFPEYVIVSDLSGPTAPRLQPFGVPLGCIQKTGRIFVFGPEKIQAAKHAVETLRMSKGLLEKYPPPSTFACLAALTWSYTTIMRMGITPGSSDLSIDTDPRFSGVEWCHLLMPASWARRAFQDINHAGNSIALPIETTSLSRLYDVTCSSPGQPMLASKTLGPLVHYIDITLASITDESIATRTAMFRAAPDPRMIGIDQDPRDPRRFAFNSWRHLGADTLWGIPGTGGDGSGAGGVPPDAVRRAQDVWNMGAGLIMPGRKQGKYEVLVTLDTVSMERLCSNEGWMRWVDEIIE